MTFGTCISQVQNTSSTELSAQHQQCVFAVGSKCGRIALVDVTTMQQQELVSLTPANTFNVNATTSSAPSTKNNSGLDTILVF